MKARLPLLVPYVLLLIAKKTMSQLIDCANPADIMFLLDGSDSIDSQEWAQARAFVARMIDDFDITPDTINVGITVYSSDIDNHIPLTPFTQKIVLKFRTTTLPHPTGITTNTARGIQKVRDTFLAQPFSRRGAPKIAIVITDGTSVNPAETIRQANLAKEAGIRMIAVGVGNNVFEEELRQIASNQRKYYPVADYNTLRSIEAGLRAMICRVITTTRAPPVTFAPPTLPPGFIPIGQDRICNVPGDIVFVIDGSDSISDQDFVRLKNFVANLIDNFEIGSSAIHVGMIVYSTLVGETIGLQSAQNKIVLKALAKNLAHPKFGTDTAAGIEAARNMINDQGRPQAPEIIVVITDGRSTNPRNTILQANRAKADGITMLAVGVGNDIFQTELDQIASSRELVSVVKDFTSLANTVNFIRNLICTSITTTPPTTTSMMPPTPPPVIDPPPEGLICNVPGDVVFLLDGSQSINDENWRRQKNFVANLINNLEVGPQYIHVSIIVFSTTIGDLVPLTPYKPKSVLSMQVKGLTQPKDATDTALGIEKAREIIFMQGRPDAPKVIIVITDGKSTFTRDTRKQAHMAKADGITMIAVGVGTDIYEDELREIATSPRKVFKSSFADLKNIIAQLRDKICQVVQTTTLAPTTTPRPTTTTQIPTPAPVPLFPCMESQTAADMVFLIDGSLSTRPYEWMMKTHFVTNFLDGLEIRREYVHVGVVISDHISQRGDFIGIAPFNTRSHLKDLIHGLISPKHGMDTVSGLKQVSEVFTTQSRQGAPKFMILVTDGSSGPLKFQQAMQQAAAMKNQGVTIISVGVGNKVDLTELRNIASHPSLVVRSSDFSNFLSLLPTLQQIVCALLKKPETTTMVPTTPNPHGLCEGCLIANGVGYNPYPGDCTKFVQCWRDGDTIKSLVRSCPFGQFWDADAITCRPSFLVICTADPCRNALPGFTYGMPEYGCRAYWKCIDGFSVGHCCSEDSAYVEGMGCLEDIPCFQSCPPEGGIAVRPSCDRRPHWDKRYYIQIIHGRGELVRPCPAGTVYVHERCGCDFGMSGLLPTTPEVLCQPAAYFSFDADLLDKSANKINTGITNVKRTDLGTAFFNGRSEMNLWRFAGVDWGNTLVIKFKFRFDYSNKFVDYGGLPVDLGNDWRINMNLLKDFKLTDLDWRLWNRMRRVMNLDQWRQLLNEFGKTKMFYIFLGQLGFKPGTSNSVQVIRILGTPEAYREIRVMLDQLRNMGTSPTDMQGILAKLRSLRGYINWTNIVKQLQDKAGTGDTGSTGGTTVANVTDISGTASGSIPHGAVFIRKYNHVTGEWEIVPGSGPGKQLGPDEAEWRWNSLTQNWERTVVTGGSGAASGSSGGSWTTGTGTGGIAGGASGASWQTETSSGGTPGTVTWNWATGSQKNNKTSSNFGGFFTWQDLMREVHRMQQQNQGVAGFGVSGAAGGMAGGLGGVGGEFGGVGGAVGGMAGGLGGVSGEFGGVGGAVGGMAGGLGAVTGEFGGVGGAAGGFEGGLGGVGVDLGGVSGGAGGSGSGWQWQYGGQTGNIIDTGVNAALIDEILRQLKMAAEANTGAGTGGTSSGSSWQWSQSSGTDGKTGISQPDMAKLNAILRQIQQASTGNTWDSGMSGTQLDTTKLDAILKQLQAGAATGSGTGWSDGGSWYKSGNWSVNIPPSVFITSGGKAATIKGGMGFNSGVKPAISKQIIETRIEKAKPKTEEAVVVPVTGGRVVGGTISGTFSQTSNTKQTIPQTGGRIVGGTIMRTVSQTRKTSPELGGTAAVMGGAREGGVVVGRGSIPVGGLSGQTKVVMTGKVTGQGIPIKEQMITQEFVDAGTIKRPVIGGGTEFNIVRQKVPAPRDESAPKWFPARTAPRGAAAKGVLSQNIEGQIVGLRVPARSGVISGATVLGNTGIQEVPVINPGPRLRIKEIVQEVNPVTFETKAEGLGGAARVETQRRIQSRLIPGQTTGTFSKTVQVQGGGTGGAAGFGGSVGGGTMGASGRWSLSGEGAGAGGISGGGSGFAGRTVQVLPSGSGMAGGDFTQMGKVFGTGGGIKRVIDTNMKRVPAGAVQFETGGGVSLDSLGLGGAEGSNIIRRTIQIDGGGAGTAGSVGGEIFSTSGGNFIDAGTIGGGGGGASGGSGGFITQRTVTGGQSGVRNNVNDLMFLTGVGRESAENLLDGFGGKKRKRRSASRSRSKRAVNKQAYQALVTNCQGQGVQGPSIMIVANQGEVQFALKTKNSNDPGVIAVPAVEGWNDVTLVYDGSTLTGIVENWKGYHKSTINLSGDIERRQAGLLVGSCQGFASFHGEIDDLTVYQCITPAMQKLRDRTVV